MQNFQFANPEVLYALIALPVLLLLFIISMMQRYKQLKKFGDLKVLSSLMPEVSIARPAFKFLLILIASALIIIAIARPQFGSKLQEVKKKGAEIIVVLDVSNSMMAEDIYPNRLDNAKRALVKLVDKLYDDKIGLIVFAGEAYTQVPITLDYSATKMFIRNINCDLVPTQGTAIGAAVKLAMSSFTPNTDKGRVVIVISDGENHEDDAVATAQMAAEKGIVIHTIGIGSPQGSPIPVPGTSDFFKDKDGNVIITKLNEQMLKQISQAGKGLYIRANKSDLGLNALYDQINKMEKGEVRMFAEYADKFHYFIFGALVLLLIEFFFLERKNRILKNINLFD